MNCDEKAYSSNKTDYFHISQEMSLMTTDVKDVQVNLIVKGDLNPRKNFDPEYITALSNSIKRDSLWNPIIVRNRADSARAPVSTILYSRNME